MAQKILPVLKTHARSPQAAAKRVFQVMNANLR
jgi:hypothetical protein